MADANAGAALVAPPRCTDEPLLSVRDLKVHFPTTSGPFWNPRRGAIRAVDGIDFDVADGQSFGLVGESGCGKSTTARAVLNLVPPTSGEVRFEGKRIDRLDAGAMRPYRRRLQMIFQDPFASLNPRMTVGAIIGEPMAIFSLGNPRDRQFEAMRLMDLVGINPRYLNRYPHEFSGGQRQRIGIARALAVQPKLIFCDEPVSALDVSIQAQVINLLIELREKLGLSYVFIAHDLSVVRRMCDVVAVMYLGKIVEMAPAEQLYASPRHPYTQALLSAVPTPDPKKERTRARIVLTGDVPSPDREYPGCRFADRCPIADESCRKSDPPLSGAADHHAACFFAEDGPAVLPRG